MSDYFYGRYFTHEYWSDYFNEQTFDAVADGSLLGTIASLYGGSGSGTATTDYFVNAYFNPQYFVAEYFNESVAAGAGVNGFALGSILVSATSVLDGTASGTKAPVHEIVGGGIFPPYPRVPIVDGYAFGRIVKCRVRFISGSAVGTVTRLSFVEIGKASGGAWTESQIIANANIALISGFATGERYISDEEFMLVVAEAA